MAMRNGYFEIELISPFSGITLLQRARQFKSHLAYPDLRHDIELLAHGPWE